MRAALWHSNKNENCDTKENRVQIVAEANSKTLFVSHYKTVHEDGCLNSAALAGNLLCLIQQIHG